MITEEELEQLESAAGWTRQDVETLYNHRRIFEQQAEEMVDSWRAVIASQPHLAQWFFAPDGKPDEDYKAKVRKRFVQWVRDVPTRPHDREWLDYQEEIGLRHTPAKKNLTDGAHTPPVVPLRYLFAFTSVVALSSRMFFEGAGVELQDAWTKAVILHVTLWSHAYTKEGLW